MLGYCAGFLRLELAWMAESHLQPPAAQPPPGTRRTVFASRAASKRAAAASGASPSRGRSCRRYAATAPLLSPAASTGAVGANARQVTAVPSGAACAAAGRCTDVAMSQTCMLQTRVMLWCAHRGMLCSRCPTTHTAEARQVLAVPSNPGAVGRCTDVAMSQTRAQTSVLLERHGMWHASVLTSRTSCLAQDPRH